MIIWAFFTVCLCWILRKEFSRSMSKWDWVSLVGASGMFAILPSILIITAITHYQPQQDSFIPLYNIREGDQILALTEDSSLVIHRKITPKWLWPLPDQHWEDITVRVIVD